MFTFCKLIVIIIIIIRPVVKLDYIDFGCISGFASHLSSHGKAFVP